MQNNVSRVTIRRTINERVAEVAELMAAGQDRVAALASIRRSTRLSAAD